MAHYRFLVLLLFVSSGCVSFARISSLQDFQETHTRLVEGFSRAVEERISRVATKPDEHSCGCVYHECGRSFPRSDKCVRSSPHEDSIVECKSDTETCSARKVDMSKAYVRTPPGVDVETLDPNGNLAVDFCTFEGLEREGVYQTAAQWNASEFSGWAYVGTQNGAMISWPGKTRPDLRKDSFLTCKPYDPRLRPWYVPAMSPKKCIIILVDSAVAMEADPLIDSLFSTLSTLDHIALVPFNSQVTVEEVQDIQIPQATAEGKVNAKKSLDNQVASLETSFKAAFRGLTKLAPGTHDRMIVFISGSPLASQEDEMEVLETVSSLQEGSRIPVNILTFTITSRGFDNGLARKLACANDGLWANVNNFSHPNNLDNYLSFISLAVEHAEETADFAYFSPAYEDESELGKVVTVSRAVYREYGCNEPSSGPKRNFVGCVGIDTYMTDFEAKIVEDYTQSVDKLNKNNLSVRNVKDLACQLQIIRARTGTECPGDLLNPEDSRKVLHYGKSYKVLEKQEGNHSDAIRLCKEVNGVSASVRTQEVQSLISSIVPSTGAWIGMHKTSTGVWSWVDGSDFVESDTFWASEGGEGDCGLIDNRGIQDNIRKANCSLIRPIICELDGLGYNDTDLVNLMNTSSECANNHICKPSTRINVTSLDLICNWSGSGSRPETGSLEAVCCDEEITGSLCEPPPGDDPPGSSEKPVDSPGPWWSHWGIWTATGGSIFAMLLFAAVLFLIKTRQSSTHSEPIFKELIGRGASGEVWRGTLRGHPVALKVFFREHIREAEREIEIFKRLPEHPNIIRCLGDKRVELNGNVTLPLELMHMDLEQYWRTARAQPMSYRFVLRVFLDICKGLLGLHNSNVIHRDLKPRNILVKVDGTNVSVKLCDFGHSKEYVSGPASLSCPRGTYGYLSAEMAAFSVAPGAAIVGTPTDVYSFGIIMCESLLGNKAFYDTWVNESIPAQLRSLILKCRQIEPERRPTASCVCNTLQNCINSGWSNEIVIFASGQ